MSWPRLGILLSLIVCIAVFALLAWPVVWPARVAAAPAAQEGQATITSPQPNTPLTGVIQVSGSATNSQFQRYELAWSPEPVTGDAWAVFVTVQTPIENGVLGTWDTRQTPDGLYSLRLRVVRQDGNFSEIIVSGLQVANTQPVNTPTPPVGPTFEPEATGAVATSTPELIIQPPTSTPQPPTPTPASGGATGGNTSGLTGATSFSVNLGALSQAFCNGVTYVVGLFLVWGAVLGVRGVVRWGLRRVASKQVGK